MKFMVTQMLLPGVSRMEVQYFGQMIMAESVWKGNYASNEQICGDTAESIKKF